MKIISFMLAALLVLAFAGVTQAQDEAGVSGSRIRDEFHYPAGPLDGQSGADERNLLGTWNSAGDATPGEPFVVNAVDLNFGPQITLFDNPILGSIGRSPQTGIGGAERLIGQDGNLNWPKRVTAAEKESFTQLKMIWNGGKVGFGLTDREFDLSNLGIKLLPDPAGTPENPVGVTYRGWGFTIEEDAGDPNIGILKSTVFKSFANGSAGNDSDLGLGIQLTKGDTYQVFVQAEMGNATVDDRISIYVLSETDVANPESTVYLADLPPAFKSTIATSFDSSNMHLNFQFAMYATQNFQADDLKIGLLSDTNDINLVDETLRDPARQAMLAFRTVNQKIAWKSALGDPYVPGDTQLNGVLLGQPSNSNINDDDINHLQGQIRLGNTSTVNYYDLDGSGTIDEVDVEYLVETLWGSSMGDFDLDKDVDADDLTAWETNFGIGGGWNAGDANGNGQIDGDDFLTWQRNVTAPAAMGAASAVPEPSSVVLLLLAGCAALGGGRQRRGM